MHEVQTHTHTHTNFPYKRLHTHVASALTDSHQCGDVIRALMRDYSDITGSGAKLNLLASPCARGALQLELCTSMCDMEKPTEKPAQSVGISP